MTLSREGDECYLNEMTLQQQEDENFKNSQAVNNNSTSKKPDKVTSGYDMPN
jgi:hypothetical protein